MKESVVVSMTGFVNDPQEEAYKHMITDLRMRLAPVLSEQTSVLIVNDVSTEKYKIAKTYDTPISCVSIDWLLECRQRNRLITTTNYQIRKLFFGVQVKLVGFEIDKAKRLKQKIIKNGGKASIMHHNKELSALANNEDRTSLILTSQSNFSKLKHYLNHIPYPIVGLEWIEDSFQNDLCKYPFDYALNQTYISSKEPKDHYPKMKKKLDLQLASQPIDQFQPKILENTFIYLSPSINSELATLLKKLIMVYGGFYLEEHSSIITHILTQPMSEEDYHMMKVYGMLVHLIRVEWLIDSIYIHKRMKEEDYLIRSFKARGEEQQSEEKQNSMMMVNSMSYHSFGGLGMSLPSMLNNRKSISMKAKVGVTRHAREVKVTKKFTSTIFKGHRFYIQSTQKKEIELHDLASKIIKNGGEVCSSRVDIKEGNCFYILKDSSDCNHLIERIKLDTRGRARLCPISYRWLNECLSKSQFIDVNKQDSYIYRPFNFKTPILGFHKMIFEVLGLDDVLKLRLKELYNVLGSAKNMANKSQITHCLCGVGYSQTNRGKQLRKENESVRYVSWKWLIECSSAGKIIDLQNFMMDRQGSPSTDENQNSNQACIFPIEQTTA